MRRYFVKTNAYNCVVFADGSGKGYMFYEGLYDEPLTLEVAQNGDYSGIETLTQLRSLQQTSTVKKMLSTLTRTTQILKR